MIQYEAFIIQTTKKHKFRARRKVEQMCQQGAKIKKNPPLTRFLHLRAKKLRDKTHQ